MENNTLIDPREQYVVKSNRLIQQARFSLSLVQQKIILYLISKIEPTDKEFRELEFDIIEFCKVCGIDHDNGKNYKDLKDAIKGIRDQSAWIQFDDYESLCSWIEKAKIYKGKGTIKVRLDDDLMPYLLQLKSNYTQYQLIFTLHFSSKYSIRLYEWLCSMQYDEMKEHTFAVSLEKIRERLDATTYKEYKNLKARVLLPAIKDINSYSDKNVSFEEIKKGRKGVQAVKFTVSTKDTLERIKIEDMIDRDLGTDQLRLF